MSTTDPLKTPAQAAEFLGVKEQTLATWRCTGRYNLPFIRVGRNGRYRLADLERWIAERTAVSTGDAEARLD